jgi:AcrR family transcriptional regulator
VIAEATAIFAEKGFHATGVAEIGDAAGIQRGALYYHIKSKNELLYEIVSAHVEELIAQAEQIFNEVSDPLTRLRRVVRSFMVTIEENRDETTLYLREMHALKAPYDEKMRTLRATYESYWSKALEQGVAEGHLRSADPVVVKGLIGMFGYSYVWFKSLGEQPPQEIADQLLDIVLRGALTTSAGGSPGHDTPTVALIPNTQTLTQ